MISRIAIVNRGEAAMRLVHAVRDLNAASGPEGHRIVTVALHTEGERRAMFVRESDEAYDLGPGLGPALPRPRPSRAGAARDRGGRRLGRLGFRGRGRRLRRAVRPHRRDVHRAEPRGHAPAGRQDRQQAHRRGGGGAGRALEWGWGRHAGRRDRRRRPDRLPAHAQGDRRRWRARHPPGRLRRRPHRRLRANPRRGPAGLRLGGGLSRAARHRRPAHRGAGHRRHPRHGLGHRRA